MFRKMRRFKQQISDAECREVLFTQKRGVLSLIGENGYPYGIPMDHWYCEEDGCGYKKEDVRVSSRHLPLIHKVNEISSSL
ncbi:hypothetical protein SAMN02910262_00772 [[Clostridium] aminophilum]|uniref:Uncharacterized protein n=2 Tax=[Clostridium] aminophilum TaxID=1526 RepID=A0A1I6ISS7_9FIRM|nr:hypothetical protein SAMN02910262_00772 [[Clostridium] aminophilum]